MFYFYKPENFNSKFNIVICYCIYKNEILFLRRKEGKFQGKLWTAPGGKQESKETPIQGIKRELLEETSLDLDEKLFQETGLYYIKNPIISFTIRIFKVNFDKKPDKVVLSDHEHDQYLWIKKNEVLKLDLVDDADQCFINTFHI